MKEYVKPSIQLIHLRTEERLAGSCQCCGTDAQGNLTAVSRFL